MKPIAITLGDPAGIGAEVVFRALEQLDPAIPVRIFGDRGYAAKTPGGIPERAEEAFVDVATSGARPLDFGVIDGHYGKTALVTLEAALEAIDRGECAALVTGPIHKQAILAAGATHPGHTELLAERAGLSEYGRDHAMFFDSPRLRVALLSVHVPLAEAIELATAARVRDLAHLCDREHQRLFGGRPRIAVAGINPHAGEGGRFGSEDARIAEGVEMAKEEGLTIAGPLPPDTVYLRASRGAWDIVLAAYHDQGLIAVKTLDFERSVNVTIGLPYLRCSVDHGTAFDIAGRGIADPTPMRYAIEWAAHHVERLAEEREES
ncbi:MAG: 4-hydroxythreonine-4-phosphate dehydrogenase PdxA [Thermoanaerobaculia bacterium]